MKIKLSILIILFLISCQKNETPKPKKFLDYKLQIDKVKNFAKNNNYNQKIALLIDYSLHSGLKRFFVVDLKKNKFLNSSLVCHGSCKGDNKNDYSKYFSNTNDSYCTSLGMALVEERAYSKWGKHFKYWLKGLEQTNNNIRERVVVLHAWEGVDNNEIYPKALATSFGCPTVSIAFLDSLDIILKEHKNILLYSFE